MKGFCKGATKLRRDLPSSPLPVPIPENVDRLPTARAIRDYLNPRQKPPKYPDEGELLSFAEAAVTVGFICLEKWEGKRCFGRHYGCVGAFPAKMVDLRAPTTTTATMTGTGTGIGTATAGTGSSKDAGVWLSFGKGEVIRDVQCLYADYWCWSGTNGKGKTGVFPSSHVDLSTLREQKNLQAGSGSGRMVLKKGSRVGRGLFSRRGGVSLSLGMIMEQEEEGGGPVVVREIRFTHEFKS
ncbi:hypothetical protein QBC44DRAFT_313743 [Cladorrhinum sp. PSN332]|nr:hypothetical protein QBC44DRAFT_313743 [Cladorrhinum sp. PSN332]